MIELPSYAVNLYLNGQLIGDCREHARDLTWTRRMTAEGVDSIEFTVNDVVFANWCEERGTTLGDMLRPVAVECRVVRDGVEVVGGFLATVPDYSPTGMSADLGLSFDGYLNLLAGVYIYPTDTQTSPMATMISKYITEADERAAAAGKAYGFTAGTFSDLASVTQTFDDYKSVKDFITDRCDNTTGAGPFEVYFHADKTYDIIADSEFGDEIGDYIISYPAGRTGVGAVSMSASGVESFASAVLAIGAGETSGDEDVSTAITSLQVNSEAVATYGYYETLLQESSVSVQSTLDTNAQTELAEVSVPIWTPSISLTGAQVSPTPEGAGKIWVGDYVQIENTEDLTGMTSGRVRVLELSVSVSASNAETITPTVERVDESAD